MQRLRAILQKYAHILWRSALGLLAVVSVLALVGVFLSGRGETDSAFNEGRRLIIALDTGEMEGKRISLDKPGEIKKPAAPDPAAQAPTPPVPVETAPEANPQAPAETTPETVPAPEDPKDGEQKPEAKASAPAVAVTPTAEPNPEITEEVNGMRLPIIGKDGTKPWRYYSKPYERTRNQPMVAIIVTGLGIGKAVTQDALTLHENIALSFSPYAREIAMWAPAVRANGHELLVDLPLQPANYPATDPGPNALLLERGPADAEKQLQWAFSRFPAFIGAVTPTNEAFTANDEGIKMLLQSFANRGLLFVMGVEPYRKETRDVVDATVGTAALISNVFIDEEPSLSTIQQRLTQLEEQAKRSGYAVGIAQAYPLTIQQLKEWSQTLEKKGIVLVPVSAIAKLRFS